VLSGGSVTVKHSRQISQVDSSRYGRLSGLSSEAGSKMPQSRLCDWAAILSRSRLSLFLFLFWISGTPFEELGNDESDIGDEDALDRRQQNLQLFEALESDIERS
jgi:hypothetical protein